MVLGTGQISFSEIQTEFGGTNPVSFSEYYTNANPSYTNGISGLPTIGNAINIGNFKGKAKQAISGGSIASTDMSIIYSGLQPYLSEYKHTSFYNYILDGDAFQIYDGGADMYDIGNNTRITVDGVLSDNLSYSTTSATSITLNGKLVSYVSLGYTQPLVMLAKSSTRASWGFRKSGNLGADGSGSSTNFNVYSGGLVNGFTVYAWCRQVYGTSDPSIGDLYFAIGDSSSTFYSTVMSTFDPNNTDDGVSYMSMDCVNVLFGCILCSKASGVAISVNDCQYVITAITSRLLNILTLYTFNTHTFTNANAYGAQGPTLLQCRTAYSSVSWTQDTINNYLNMTTQGIQQWKVPRTGNYTIEMSGAAGGFICDPASSGTQGGTTNSGRAGYGYKISGIVNLTKGTILNIVVGQRGVGWPAGNNLVSTYDQAAGGGGASCVFIGTTLLMIAAGGNGQSWDGRGTPDPDGQGIGSTVTSTSQGRGFTGATFNTNGDGGTNNYAFSILNGAVGGNSLSGYASAATYTTTAHGALFAGGFGGGGGTNPFEGGGGGGYVGGIPSGTNKYNIAYPSQGASSYASASVINPTNLGTNTTGTLSSYTNLQGYVKITYESTI